MIMLTIDSIHSDLKDVVDSIESLVGAEPSDQTDAQGNAILGRLFTIIHKLNYLIQSRMTDFQNVLQSSSTVATKTTTAAPNEASGLLDEFDSIIRDLKDALAKVAKFLKAAQYTLGVQFPFSISASITFTP
jgi:ElaB/YqjD/DUF883 family membrane-anchored ribosome-binding protein